MKKLLFLIPLGLAGILASCQQELEPSANVDSQVAEATFVEPEPDSVLVNTYELNRVISKYAQAVGMPISRSAADEVLTVNDEEGTPVLYIVNKANDGGFFIVSARKNAMPLLAYNNKGNFDFETLKSSDAGHPMLMWVENIKDAILADELADSVAADTWKSFEMFKQGNLGVNSRALDNGELNRLRAIMMDKTAEWSADPETKVYTFEEFRIAYPDKAAYYSEVLPGGMIYLNYYEDYEQLTLFVERSETIVSGSNGLDIRWAQSDEHNLANPWNMSFPTYIDKTGKTCHYPAGCTTVAAGQIMREARYPTYFNWDEMHPIYPSKVTSDFLYEIAKKSNPKYYDDSTSEGPGLGIKLEDITKTLQGYGYVAEYKDKFNEGDIITPCIIESDFISTPKGQSIHSWTLTGLCAMANERTLSCWTFPQAGEFREIDRTQLSFESLGKMRYANWGFGGEGNCWISNIKYAFPISNKNNSIPEYTSGQAVKMIVNIHPK